MQAGHGGGVWDVGGHLADGEAGDGGVEDDGSGASAGGDVLVAGRIDDGVDGVEVSGEGLELGLALEVPDDDVGGLAGGGEVAGLPLLNASAVTGKASSSPSSPGMRPRSSPVGFRRCARPSEPPHASAPFVGLHWIAPTSHRSAAAAKFSACCAGRRRGRRVRLVGGRPGGRADEIHAGSSEPARRAPRL